MANFGAQVASAKASAVVHGKRGTRIEIESELQLGGVRHAAGSPGRIEDDLGVDFSYFGQLQELAFDIGAEHVSHAAARRGHGHFDFDFVSAGFGRRDFGQPITDLVNGTLRVFAAGLPLF